jgi:hypothetical protein
MIKGPLGVFVLLSMSQYFHNLSQFLFGISIHLTHNSISNVVIFLETFNSKRTERAYKY